MIVRLRGNGDWGSDLPAVQTLHIAGKKIFATHGHLYNVKWGTTAYIWPQGSKS